MRITVFTPTYNRGYIIENLYHSLQRQTFLDFEWIVIDDGSNDNTEELCTAWCKEANHFEIIYQKTENGGKHRAINKGIQMARGDLFFIVDSDDYLTDDALERVDYWENSIQDKSIFCGICGLKGRASNKLIGSTFDGNYADMTMLERSANGVTGDKAEVFYTKILRKYPFPEFPGEKFVTECVVWDKIAFDGYKFRFFNEIIYICEYLADGLTAHYYQLIHSSPKGWGQYIYQSVEYGKLSGFMVQNAYFDYYIANQGKVAIKEMANNLRISHLSFIRSVAKTFLYYKLKSFTHLYSRLVGKEDKK